MNNVVVPALNEISMEMKNLGINVSLKIKSSVSVVLYVVKDDAVDFLYEVSLRKYKVPEYAVVKNEKFCRAEVFLLNGGQGYDVFGYTKQQIIADVVTQYEKHIHYLQQSLEI